MATINSVINEIAQVSQTMEEEEDMFESMNAALDRQIEQDMLNINNILKQNSMAPTATFKHAPKPTPPKLMPKPIPPKPALKPILPKLAPKPPKLTPKPPKLSPTQSKTTALTDFERIEQQIMDEEVDQYESMNLELDKQIARDMEAIRNYLNKAGETMDIAKRIEFFNSMEVLPSNNDNVTDHILFQHTPLGNIKWHECAKCSFRSTEQSKLKEHMVTKHKPPENGWLTCSHCDFKAKVENDIQKHVALMHRDTAIICKDCDSVFSSKSDLITHMLEKHGVEMGVKCKQCSHIAEDESSLRQHTLFEHVKLNFSWYKCAQCAYRTVRKANLDRHIMYKHSSGKIFI